MNTKHWDKIYSEKQNDEMSWFQEVPKKSLEFIKEFALKQNDAIIDIGGGDSRFVDSLLGLGFKDISVLDISENALNKTAARLVSDRMFITLIHSDVTQFNPAKKYKLWHDRATFHFLTKKEDIESYIRIAHGALDENGYLIVSTFSKTGPEKCSGLEITRYSDIDLKSLFQKFFQNVKCVEDTHQTPWGTKQDFVFCSFKKKKG